MAVDGALAGGYSLPADPPYHLSYCSRYIPNINISLIIVAFILLSIKSLVGANSAATGLRAPMRHQLSRAFQSAIQMFTEDRGSSIREKNTTGPVSSSADETSMGGTEMLAATPGRGSARECTEAADGLKRSSSISYLVPSDSTVGMEWTLVQKGSSQ